MGQNQNQLLRLAITIHRKQLKDNAQISAKHFINPIIKQTFQITSQQQ